MPDPLLSEIDAAKVAHRRALTRQHVADHRARQTPEERAARARTETERSRAKRAAMTPEERETANAKRRKPKPIATTGA